MTPFSIAHYTYTVEPDLKTTAKHGNPSQTARLDISVAIRYDHGIGMKSVPQDKFDGLTLAASSRGFSIT